LRRAFFRIALVTLVAGALFSCAGRGGVPDFDGQRAYRLLAEQCRMGPRFPGSEGHARELEWLKEELSKWTPEVTLQEFSFSSRVYGERLELTNVIASFGPKGKATVVLGAHWDTKRRAERDPDRLKTDEPVPGANDGASGVAVLLELARLMHSKQPSREIKVVLFDGEDVGNGEVPEEIGLGSRHFATNLESLPGAVIVIDMIGDKELEIYPELNSLEYSENLTRFLWRLAERMKLSGFRREPKHRVLDDHAPFLLRGVPAVLLIDIDYPYWHTTEDTPEKCSPESLEQVGELLVEFIYRGLPGL